MRPAVFAAIAVGVAGVALGSVPRQARPGWTEIAWPYPVDPWPPGRAFRCASAACGGDAVVTIRPKLGFCSNCALGVTEDSEVDGVSDVDMIAPEFMPFGPGEPLTLAGMRGRTRNYMIHLPDGDVKLAAGTAVSRKCDLFVVASQGAAAGSPASRAGIAALMESEAIKRWIGAL